MKRVNLLTISVLIVLVAVFLVICHSPVEKKIDYTKITSYKDIPKVTQEEIDAIEALKQEFDYFTYGMLLSTEAFIDRDGNLQGFAKFFCEWLSELFGIEFIPQIVTWVELLTCLEAHKIDFTGYLMNIEERRDSFFMTSPIVSRPVKLFQLAGSPPINEIRQRKKPVYGTLVGSAIVGEITRAPIYDFELVVFSDFRTGYEMLKRGTIDAIVTINISEPQLQRHANFTAEYFIPLLYNSASLMTQNSALSPIISVVQKAIDSNITYFLRDLYQKGYLLYQKHLFYTNLSKEELLFIENNPIIPFFAEFDNYPISFFNYHTNQWEGIIFDCLNEIEVLTGLRFQNINTNFDNFYSLLSRLEKGEAAFLSEVIRTREREGRFLWTDASYYSAQVALISNKEHRNIRINDIFHYRVGLVKGTMYVELFNRWFPSHNLMTEYESQDKLFQALRNNEIDLAVHSSNTLVRLTHFDELPYYKINLLLDYHFESRIGFNKEQEILVSIFEKAAHLVDIETISNYWIRRTYDYQVKLAQELAVLQRFWMILVITILTLTLTFMIITYTRHVSKNKVIANQKAEMSVINNRLKGIMDNLPGMVFQCLNNYPTYTFTFVSQGCLELTGYTEEELIKNKMSIWDLFHPDDREYYSNIEDSFWLQPFFESEYRFICKDGSIKWIWERSRVFERGEDGLPILMEGYLIDISARKQLEEVEKENSLISARIKSIVDSLPGVIFQCLYDVDKWTLLFICDGCRDLFGFTPEEMLTNKTLLMDLMHPDDAEKASKNCAETLLRGELCDQTYRILLPDGTIKWVWERSITTKWTDDGIPLIVDGYYFDVTEQKLLEEKEAKIQKEANRIKAILDNLHGMLYQLEYKDGSLTTIYTNEGAQNLTGYTLEEMEKLGRGKYLEMIHPDDRERFITGVTDYIKNHDEFEITYRIMLRDNSIKYVRERSVITERYEDGTPRFIGGYVIDITKEKESELVKSEQSRVEIIITTYPV